MITITYYSEVVNNWGHTESSTKPDVIKRVLQTPDEFTDDMHFEDKAGRIYFIDNLNSKTSNKKSRGSLGFFI